MATVLTLAAVSALHVSQLAHLPPLRPAPAVVLDVRHRATKLDARERGGDCKRGATRLFARARYARSRFKSLARKMREATLAASLCAMLVAGPTVERLYWPAVTARLAESKARESNVQMLESVFSLIAGQHYGLDAAAWDSAFSRMEESLHPRTLSSEEHVEAAVSSLVDTLGDSYSVYASPEQLRRPRTGIQYGLQFESRSGKQIGERGSVLQKEVVRAVLPDSSAEAAGLRIGDVILPLSAPTGTGRSEGDPRAAAGVAAPSEAAVASVASGPESTGDGDGLRLTIMRGGVEPLEVTVQPAVRSSSPIRISRLADVPASGGFVGYIRLRGFSEAGTSLLLEALRGFEADECLGYVIDLRNNPGGMIREAMHQATFFLGQPTSVVAYTLDAAGLLTTHSAHSVNLQRALVTDMPLRPTTTALSAARTDATPVSAGGTPLASAGAAGEGEPSAAAAYTEVQMEAEAARAAISSAPRAADGRAMSSEGTEATLVNEGDAAELTPAELSGFRAADFSLLPQKPLVLLIDRGTASSAELFAAALHDNGRALLLGEPSFGKGLIQRTFALPNGGALKLTIGEYLRPNMQRVEFGIGLQPDYHCVATPAAGQVDECMARAARLTVRGTRRVASPRSATMSPQDDSGRVFDEQL